MLRRLALLLCLLAPTGALAAGTITTSPLGPFGRTLCKSTTQSISLSWTFTPALTAVNGDLLRVMVQTANAACPTGTAGLVKELDATSATGYPGSTGDKLTVNDLVSKAGANCDGSTDLTIYVCVGFMKQNGTSYTDSASTSFKVTLTGPATPTNLTVGSGDGALNLSWVEGTGSGFAATFSYVVEAKAQDQTRDATAHKVEGIRATSYRLTGLQNRVIYDVKVTAESEGGDLSTGSATGTGTPYGVNDFWEQYSQDRGTGDGEQGGCAGGPAGLLSLLGVAALLRAARRRS